FAVREHDNGWRETDAAPRRDPGTGRPHDFISIPREDRIELWERGAARFAGSHPYAALLITRHALNLHASRRGQEGWESFLNYLDELSRGLMEDTGLSEDEIAADYRFLDRSDALSLAVCMRRSEPVESHGVRARYQDGTLFLDPFPLAGATTFRIPCRRIPDRPYTGDADLGVELATARWGEMSVRVAALTP
ncbi:MAG TPA: DUF3891 family protein, partial [Thermoanaerobaculia bacterium]